MEEQPSHQSSLVFRLFGGFEACHNGQPIGGLHLRQGERLLAYLILHSPRWVEKADLAKCFWSDRPVGDVDQNLRQSLSFLRQILQVDAVCLETRTGAVRLILNLEQADTLQFEAACARGDSTSLALAQQMAEETLLAGWNYEWIAPFRERYAKKLQQALARASEQNFWGAHRVASGSFAPERQVRPAGGIIPPGSPLYIRRTCDQALTTALQNSEGIVLIKGSRQIGKSSLLARGLRFAHDRHWAVYDTDFEQLAPADLADRDTLYLRLIASLAEQAGQEFSLERDWKTHSGAVGNLERFLRERVLKTTDSPIVWTLDGIDSLFKTDYYNEFFALLRGIHSKRATQPTVPWGRFTLLLATATEAHLYIRDLNQSPFNVGTRIDVADFSRVQCREAAVRYGVALEAADHEHLYELLGGHPYLLMRGLHEMTTQKITVKVFEVMAVQPNGPYHDHLEYLRRFLATDSELLADMRAVLEGRSCSDAGFFRLRSAGVVVGSSPEAARPRCGLYTRYFARHFK